MRRSAATRDRIGNRSPRTRRSLTRFAVTPRRSDSRAHRGPSDPATVARLLHARWWLGAEAVDALVTHGGSAALRGHGALLELLRAPRRFAPAHELARRIRTAVAVAAFVARLAGRTVGVTRIDRPEAAHVTGVE